jgi:hypothetical protein
MSKHEKITAELARQLPVYYPSSEDTGHYKLLEPAAKQFANQNSDINALDTVKLPAGDIAPTLTVPAGDEYIVENGEEEFYREVVVEGTLTVNGELFTVELTNNGTINNFSQITVDDEWALDRLQPLGKLVNVLPNEGEKFARYKARVLAEYAISTCEGTISDILETTAYIIDVDSSSIVYEEPAPGEENGTVEMRLPSGALDESSLTEKDITDAAERLLAASYRLRSVRLGTREHKSLADVNANNNNPDKAYDGLDANGDPKDTGGTYAGLIQ